MQHTRKIVNNGVDTKVVLTWYNVCLFSSLILQDCKYHYFCWAWKSNVKITRTLSFLILGLMTCSQVNWSTTCWHHLWTSHRPRWRQLMYKLFLHWICRAQLPKVCSFSIWRNTMRFDERGFFPHKMTLVITIFISSQCIQYYSKRFTRISINEN